MPGGSSQDPEARARSLANLKRGENPAPVGNQRRLVHGGRSELLLRDVEQEVRELMDALGEAVPVRDVDGGVPASDVTAIERAARALKRYRALAGWCDLHGRLYDGRMIGRRADGAKVIREAGEVKPAAELEMRAERELAAALDALGMTPTSRSKLGLTLQRAAASAEEAAAARAARGRLDARAADVIDQVPSEDGDG
jgi:hypothetical protein